MFRELCLSNYTIFHHRLPHTQVSNYCFWEYGESRDLFFMIRLHHLVASLIGLLLCKRLFPTLLMQFFYIWIFVVRRKLPFYRAVFSTGRCISDIFFYCLALIGLPGGSIFLLVLDYLGWGALFFVLWGAFLPRFTLGPGRTLFSMISISWDMLVACYS